MMYPHTITIFNKVVDRGRITWLATVIENVFYQDTHATVSGSENHASSDKGYVQIPYTLGHEAIKESYKSDKTYLAPHQWNDSSNNFTLRNNDYIAKGIHSDYDSTPNKRMIVGIDNVDYSIVSNQHFGITLE
jgi:hypothetical protein